jgi:hypothetical protein
MNKNFIKGLVAGFAIVISGLANAGLIHNVISPGTEYGGGSWTLGFAFTANSSLNITSLGVYDSGLDGLASDAEIGIWDEFGNLLISTTVSSGTSGELDGYFRFNDITTFTINPNQLYVIGSHINDLASSCNTGQGGDCTIDTNINIVEDRYAETSSFSFANSTDSISNGSWLGATFRYESVDIPEPTTLTAFALALIGLSFRNFKRQA